MFVVGSLHVTGALYCFYLLYYPQAGHLFLSGSFRRSPFFSGLKILSKSIVFQCQTAWITMRRRVTRRLIWIQAVWKYHHSFFRSTHICQNLRIFHGPIMVTLDIASKHIKLHVLSKPSTQVICCVLIHHILKSMLLVRFILEHVTFFHLCSNTLEWRHGAY